MPDEGAATLRLRFRLALLTAVLLVPVVVFAKVEIGLAAALGTATLSLSLLVLSWTSWQSMQALARLRQHTERWQFALDGAGHGVFDWNPITGAVFRSDGWHKLVGYSRAEMEAVDDDWIALVHPDDREAALAFRARLREAGTQTSEGEYRIRHASGAWRWVVSRARVFGRDAAGRAERVVGTTTDLSELKEARQEVQDSLDVFRAMFEESAHPMFLANVKDTRLTMVNRSASEAFGLRVAEMIGRTGAQVGLWSGVEEGERFWTQLRERGRVRNFLVHATGRDGGQRTLLLFGDPIRVRGEPLCLIHCMDVTDRERSAAAAHRAHELQRALFEHSPLPMAVVRFDDLVFTDVNQSAVEFFGVPRLEVVGAHIDKLGLFEGSDLRDQFLATLHAQGRIASVDWRLRAHDGTVRDLALSAELVVSNGETLIIAQITDLTQRRDAERRAAQLTRFYSALSEILEAGTRAHTEDEFLADLCRICAARIDTHLGYAVWLDESGKGGYVRAHAGEHAERFLEGLDVDLDAVPEECIINNDVAADAGLGALRERLAAAGTLSLSALPLLQGGRIIGALYLHHRHRDAYDEPTVELVKRIALSASRTLDKLAFDRERRRGQEELARLNRELDTGVRERTRELQTTVRELESFSYSVAHDLRAPLRAINGYLQLGADPAMEPEAARDYLRKAATSVAGLAELIDDLLEFARAGRRSLERNLVDMDRLAREVAEPLQSLHPRSEVVIRPLPPVAGDAFLLRQVLHNLIENALKFSSGTVGARIEVYAEENERHYVYRVRDNGVGVDMAYSEKLFGVFERLHDARQFPGTGVGLAIVKRIVERHAGRVWCDSRPGEGAIFSFSLAIPAPALPETIPAEAEHGNPAG